MSVRVDWLTSLFICVQFTENSGGINLLTAKTPLSFVRQLLSEFNFS